MRHLKTADIREFLQCYGTTATTMIKVAKTIKMLLQRVKAVLI